MLSVSSGKVELEEEERKRNLEAERAEKERQRRIEQGRLNRFSGMRRRFTRLARYGGMSRQSDKYFSIDEFEHWSQWALAQADLIDTAKSQRFLKAMRDEEQVRYFNMPGLYPGSSEPLRRHRASSSFRPASAV